MKTCHPAVITWPALQLRADSRGWFRAHTHDDWEPCSRQFKGQWRGNAIPAISITWDVTEDLCVACAVDSGQLVQGLLALLLLGLEEAKDAVLGEARGECGPPEVPVQDINPEALHHAAVATQADAMSAAALVRWHRLTNHETLLVKNALAC